MPNLHSAVGTWQLPCQTIPRSNTGLCTFSVLWEDPLSSLMVERRSRNTGHLQPPDDESHQNKDGACLHVGLYVMHRQNPAPFYTLSATRKEGGAGGRRAGRVSKYKPSKECPQMF